jgi:hypothetical protein
MGLVRDERGMAVTTVRLVRADRAVESFIMTEVNKRRKGMPWYFTLGVFGR